MAIEKLNFLIGTWIGKGTAVFPTIKTTEYLEELIFTPAEDKSVIFFELKSWTNKNGSKGPILNWQSGFLNELEDGTIEMCDAQNNGRVEVLLGNLEEKDYPYHLSFVSKMFGNDERMVKTSRDYYVNGNEMKYSMFMSTLNTPEFQKHLEAELTKKH